MKRIIILLIIPGWFIFCGNTPSTGSRIQSNLTSGTPVMKFEKSSYDFGQIKKGEEARHIFTFTNDGKKPLVIISVRSSCGCTTPTWSRDPVKKNKKGTITVVYNTHIPGKFRKKITIISNAINSPVTLIIQGEVIPHSTQKNNT